jgi:DNA-binding transcriptional LysR family regulator
MEMHQIRYFLAVSRTLNFTRAAEECNVAQPSLTRAIKLLEDELGGELFRRERNLSHLTELGTRMLPLLQQCFDSASGAKSLATSLKAGQVAPLSLALSRTIGMDLLVPHLSELIRAFPGLELKFIRGNADEVAEALKKGDTDAAVAGQLRESWERLEAWRLFTEPSVLLVSKAHSFAGHNAVDVERLTGENLLVRTYCEQAEDLDRLLKSRNVAAKVNHKVANESDLGALLEANVGVAIAPRSTAIPPQTQRIHIQGLELERSVYLYAVAGRPRSPATAAFHKLLRAADWSALTL